MSQMVANVLLALLIGGAIDGLSLAARRDPRRRAGVAWAFAAACGGALAGEALGGWLLGPLFAALVAICMATLATLAAPWVWTRVEARATRRRQDSQAN